MPLSLKSKHERLLLYTLAGIQFSHILDFMIMMPLGPVLIKELSISTHQFGILVASYSFAAAVAGLLGALFVDRFERKRLLLAIFILFGLATLACGLANNYINLLLARSCAGVFGGIMGALVQTIIADTIPFERRARATSLVATAFSISTVAGVPISLWLSNHFGWRTPFIFIALLTAAFTLLGWYVLPEIRHHINQKISPLRNIHQVLQQRNLQYTLLFSALIIFSGFTVIPYITIYSVHNIGISMNDVPWIYLCGGAATLVTGRVIGHWADLHGKAKIYRIVACIAVLPLFALTNTQHAPLWLWLICTTSFFVLVSGRMIPAMSIIVSTTPPQIRGTFMSLNATAQQLASALASTLAGYIISQNTMDEVQHYEVVGYIAIGANILAVILVGRIALFNGK